MSRGLVFFLSLLSLAAVVVRCSSVAPLSGEGLSLATTASADWTHAMSNGGVRSSAPAPSHEKIEVTSVVSVDTVTYKVAGGRRHTVVYRVSYAPHWAEIRSVVWEPSSPGAAARVESHAVLDFGEDAPPADDDAAAGENAILVVWSGRRLRSGERDHASLLSLFTCALRFLTAGDVARATVLVPRGSLGAAGSGPASNFALRPRTGVAAIDNAFAIEEYDEDDAKSPSPLEPFLRRWSSAFDGYAATLAPVAAAQGARARRTARRALVSGRYRAALIDRYALAAVDAAAELASARDDRASPPAVVVLDTGLPYGLDSPPHWVPAPFSGLRLSMDHFSRALQWPRLAAVAAVESVHRLVTHPLLARRGSDEGGFARVRRERHAAGLPQPHALVSNGAARGVLPTAVAVAPGFEPVRPGDPLVRFVGPLVARAPASEPGSLAPLRAEALSAPGPAAWLARRAPGSAVAVFFSDPRAAPAELAAALRAALADPPAGTGVLWGPAPEDAVPRGDRARHTALPSRDTVRPESVAAHPAVGVVVCDCDARIVQAALAAAVPVVCVSLGAEQDDVAARLADSGAGTAVRIRPLTARSFAVPLAAIHEPWGKALPPSFAPVPHSDDDDDGDGDGDTGLLARLLRYIMPRPRDTRSGKDAKATEASAALAASKDLRLRQERFAAYRDAARRAAQLIAAAAPIRAPGCGGSASAPSAAAEPRECDAHDFVADMLRNPAVARSTGDAELPWARRTGLESLAVLFFALSVLSAAVSRACANFAHPIMDAGWEERRDREEREAEAEATKNQVSDQVIAERLQRYVDGHQEKDKTE